MCCVLGGRAGGVWRKALPSIEWMIQVRLKMLHAFYCHLTLRITHFISVEDRVQKSFFKKVIKIAYLIKW